MSKTQTFDMDALNMSVHAVVHSLCPPMAHGYEVLRDYMNKEDAPVTVHRLLASHDTDCTHGALVGVIAAILADTTPDDLADALGINPSLASVVLAFIGVHASVDPLHIIHPDQRIGLESVVLTEARTESGIQVHAHVETE